jgi:hypothetical protein
MARLAQLGLAFFVATLLATGCISVKSVVDPAYGKTKYEDIVRPAEPFKWGVSVQFQRNGEPVPKADAALRDNVERALRASGVAVPPDSASGANGKTFHKSGIRHALHTAVGNASLPEGLEPVPPSTAFGRIVEQMLLIALKEFQQSRELSSPSSSTAHPKPDDSSERKSGEITWQPSIAPWITSRRFT